MVACEFAVGNIIGGKLCCGMGRNKRWQRIFTIVFLLLISDCEILNAGPMGASSEKILGLFQLPGYSHFVMFEALMKELAAQGHQVTVVSHFPQKIPIVNYTDISIRTPEGTYVGGFSVEQMLSYNMVSMLYLLWSMSVDVCEKTMVHPEMLKLIESKEHYDLVILETFGADCGYGVAWKLGTPIIAMTSLARMPWGQLRMGNPENPAISPLVYTPHTPRMNFWQRLHNSLAFAYAVFGYMWYTYPAVESLNKRTFGSDVPPLSDLLRNTSVTFINSHFSLNGAIAAVPGLVEVGGIHVAPDRSKLSQSLLDWLDGADEKGVVYVSFGSLIRAETMPLVQLRIMAKVLGSLSQRVVWKCDGKAAAERLGSHLAPNIHADDWMHQATVLDHPNVRMFISHGGLMGIQEALQHGTPMLVIPLIADQEHNANILVNNGMAIKMYFEEITEETFRKSLTLILDDDRYAENARRVSELFRDRPRPPLQEAVFWTEYVMRHRGAPHMQSAAVHLRWWQLLLLDVLGAAFAAVAAAVAAALLLFRCLCRRSPSDKVKRS